MGPQFKRMKNVYLDLPEAEWIMRVQEKLLIVKFPHRISGCIMISFNYSNSNPHNFGKITALILILICPKQ